MSSQKIQNSEAEILDLIDENKGIILKVCNTYCYHEADREDLAQEIIIRLWKGFPTYQPDFKFSTWMYRVALNVAISFHRNNRKWNENRVYPESSLENIAIDEENKKLEEKLLLLQQKVASLKPFDKAIMLLYFEEKSYKEIAEIVGITETNVATKIGRLKEKLKQELLQKK